MRSGSDRGDDAGADAKSPGGASGRLAILGGGCGVDCAARGGLSPADLTPADFAIFSAAARTSRTRRPQPLPKVGQVRSPCRKASRSSQIASIRAAAFARFVAATVSGPTSPSTAVATSRCSTLAARPIPELTP
jgi:hypothetical protein